MQHRAWQRSQGIEVGPLIYYFGSRYRSQEYLYGEDIEAYIASGIISHAGLAFSRDSDSKTYIQHKMSQDKSMLARLLKGKGSDAAYFYLCGPTWPVPDVYEALVGSLTREGGMERKEAEEYLEELKEEERYVLEVYVSLFFFLLLPLVQNHFVSLLTIRVFLHSFYSKHGFQETHIVRIKAYIGRP